ncbi:hypothetical protein SAMN05518847_10542 [Paenibacillus sp. OV219]|nr:hypothetical protein SAMN05518847_10542 [Paenibacillus sp. OV219]
MEHYLQYRVWYKMNGHFNNKIIYGPTIKTPSDALSFFKKLHGIQPSHAELV